MKPLKAKELAACNQTNDTFVFGEILKDEENAFLVLKCRKKHCGRCYLHASRHILYKIHIMRRQERTKRRRCHFMSRHAATENNERFLKAAQKVYIIGSSKRLFHITFAQSQSSDIQSANI